MENEKLSLNGYEVSCYNINTLIIGSGAASLNAAVSLDSFGVKDIVIATAFRGGGTSNNAGSDKQTYYKLSLSGKDPDSVIEMASDLFNGRCMHGDIALCEAQGSVQAFMHLVDLGVGFPRDKYGSFAGYKTDHDPRNRATSAGPYTSKRMFEALAADTMKRNIKVLDNHQVIKLLTDKSRQKVIGALAINASEKDYKKAFVLFNSVNIILGTGGPAGIYETSVYPYSQAGSIGMAFAAGASGQNLTESQFGIASLKFRWNLSGSYQQAIPRYISTDKDGNDEKEFLNDFFPDMKSLTKAIFLKGYQWPFDPRKINGFGSSLIDILVNREINDKNRKVFLDYTRNPSGKYSEGFSLEGLDDVVKDYLQNSDALGITPIQRLKAINTPAFELYKEHGIDLSEEYVQIAVCAQHNNGGLKGNIWWESDLRHLFPVGEVNGSHGVYRPGGSALNSGQTGSYRAAQFISRNYNYPQGNNSAFHAEVIKDVAETLALSDTWMSSGKHIFNQEFLEKIRNRMSASGGIIRNRLNVHEASVRAMEMTENITGNIGADSVSELADCFLLLDHCITHFIYLKAINFYIENGGRSRGSYLVINSKTPVINDKIDPEPVSDMCSYDRESENNIIEAGYKNNEVFFKMEQVREIPVQDLWFEKVWKEYLQDNSPGC